MNLQGVMFLIVFVVFVFGCFFSFIGGWLIGRKQAAAEYALDQKMKAQSDKEFKQLKDKLFKGGGSRC